MTSWVYIFSKFTPEALLIEAFFILLLCAAYAVFWVLKKRRFGALDDTIPSGVAKDYLGHLIGEAQSLRTQLFGLLSGQGADSMGAGFFMPSGGAGAGDPEAARKLMLLEAKMAEQSAAMNAIIAEKEGIERSLAEAKAQAQGSAAFVSGSTDTSMIAELEKKIKMLEGKLAEYSVIEDDLANLKRLQQENAQLRGALAGNGGSIPPPNISAAQAPAPPPPAPILQPVPEPEPVAAAPAAPAPELEAVSTPTASPGPDLFSNDSNLFDTLVNEVEKSLETNPVAAPPPPVEVAPTPAAAAPPSPKEQKEQSDEDLVAEFEKMLSGLGG